MPRRLIASFLLLAGIVASARGATPLDLAISLYHQHRYPEAKIVLDRLVVTDPANAEACHYLGLTISKRNDADALDQAIPWLEKAASLAPRNADIIGDYGGICLLLAGRHRSISYATKGRSAMQACIAIDPDNLDARDGLMRFYAEAPWPFGSASKALEQAEEIAKRDPAHGFRAFLYLKRNDKDYDGIFALCDQALQVAPDNYIALLEYGRAAADSGRNLDRGIERLRHCLTLTPPPHMPGLTTVHYQLGLLLEKQGNVPAARRAYQAAVALDVSNHRAAEALAKLKS